MTNKLVPIITIDGPSGVGKGTIAHMLADKLGWHYLDSGALYRAAAWGALRDHIDSQDEANLVDCIQRLQIEMKVRNNQQTQVICDDVDISDAIRLSDCSDMTSKISAIPGVRAALLQRQKDMAQLPGLVTDGRDMGTVVFPEAALKLYFIADPAERAKRRYFQLKEKGINASLREIRQELDSRDKRDESRDIAPSKPAQDAIIIDTTQHSIEDVMQLVLKQVSDVFGHSR